MERSKDSDNTVIYVATTSQVKIDAVRAAIQAISDQPQATVTILGYEGIESNVPEQPVGIEETRSGCLNRLNHLLRKLNETNKLFAFAIAIENGICLDCSCTKVLPYDVGIIKVYDNVNKQYSECLSERVYFDQEKYDMLLKFNQAKTIGDIFEELYGYNSKDWHAHVDPSGRSRQKLLEEAISKHFESIRRTASL